MSAVYRSSAGIIAVTCALTAVAAPVPKSAPPTPITLANVDRLRPVGEVHRDVFRMVRGPGRDRVTVIGFQTPAEVFDLNTLRSVRRIGTDRSFVSSAAGGGDTVAWCENNTRVGVEDLKAGRTVMIETGNDQPGMTFSPDGKLLATGGYGTEAKLWSPVTGQLVRSLPAGPPGGLTVVFSRDGKLTAVGNRNAETRLFETATGKLLHTFPKRMSQELQFHPSGRVLTVGYVDGSVGLWDVATGKPLGLEQARAEE